jgi:transposase
LLAPASRSAWRTQCAIDCAFGSNSRARSCGVRPDRTNSTICRRNSGGYDKALYRQRHRVEIAFGRLNDWRRIATRYDRCATTFFGAITLAAIVIFWLGQ